MRAGSYEIMHGRGIKMNKLINRRDNGSTLKLFPIAIFRLISIKDILLRTVLIKR